MAIRLAKTMFNSARLKLTAWYLLIIMLISVSFSTVIFQVSSRELERFDRLQRSRIERHLLEGIPGLFEGPRTLPPFLDPALVQETKNRLLLILVAINSGILVISGVTGYFLAGRTLNPIREMVEEQNRFISDSSHELRTPLTALKSSLEVGLRDKSLNLKEAKSLIAESIAEVNKLHSLADGLLQMAQYQKPSADTKREKISLLELISKAVQKLEPLAKEKGIIIRNRAQDVQIEGNPFSLSDLWVILLDNAIKYSPKDKTIKISSQRLDGFVRVAVEDKGMGIDKKDLPHIFDRFYRADSARSRVDTGGYGLGLSIAKKIVDLHRGSIAAKSRLGKGSVFTVSLPLSFS